MDNPMNNLTQPSNLVGKSGGSLFQNLVNKGNLFNRGTSSLFNQEDKVEITVTNRSGVSTTYTVPEKLLGEVSVANLVTDGAEMLIKRVNGVPTPIRLFSDGDFTEAAQVTDPSSAMRQRWETVNNLRARMNNGNKINYLYGVYFTDENGEFVVPTINGQQLTTRVAIQSISNNLPILDIVTYPSAVIDMRKVRSIHTLTPATSLSKS